ncbi:MAG: hypothetical protein EON56_01355 [Alphaproteobacteria bacterium]|nr:MAG: hypothetical protein EON56_01355 [Alphaproteobacteria bacterium]
MLAGCAGTEQSQRYGSAIDELARVRASRSALVDRRALEKIAVYYQRLSDLIDALDVRIADLLDQTDRLSRKSYLPRTESNLPAPSGSSGGRGSRGGAGYRLPSGKCASRR